MLADEADRNYPEAVKAYEQALAIWPGPVDWRTMYRRANCLARMRQPDAAAAARAEAKALESQMDTDVHMSLRDALDDKNLQDRSKLQKVQEFYRALGRSREVAAWQELLDRLPVSQGGIDAGSHTR
jgi:tetratricopeptide (TPR) repeat protein